MTATATALDAAPELRVALMVPERSLLEALAAGLRGQGLVVVSAFDTPMGLLDGIPRPPPDLVLVSGLGNRIGAVALARAIHARHPRLRVALLVEDAAAAVVDFADEPIDGVLRASLTLRRIALDLRRIVDGERVLPARWLYAQAPDADPLAGLSTRQREILELIAGGQSSKEMAEVLHVSLNTVKYHVRMVYARLHVSTRAQAARVLHEAEDAHGAVGR